LAIFSEATDSEFFEEFVAFDFWRIFQRQLILVFLKNLLPMIFGEFSEATDLGFLEEFAAFDFWRIFQRQLILDFLKNLPPPVWTEMEI